MCKYVENMINVKNRRIGWYTSNQTRNNRDEILTGERIRLPVISQFTHNHNATRRDNMKYQNNDVVTSLARNTNMYGYMIV